MKFSIITPTYKRPELLKRAVDSLLNQSHQDWEMIVVNDDPNTTLPFFDDKRVHVYTNEQNSGVNATRNKALSLIAEDSDRFIFLDDDDYLTTDALLVLSQIIKRHPQEKWIVTNRSYENEKTITKAPEDETHYNYTKDYLVLKRFRGDATHCIDVRLAQKITFPTKIKNGDEWLFFYILGRKTPMFYKNVTTTLSEGYTAEGLNYRPRSTQNQLQTLKKIYMEGKESGISWHPFFLFYLAMRFIRAFIKK